MAVGVEARCIVELGRVAEGVATWVSVGIALALLVSHNYETGGGITIEVPRRIRRCDVIRTRLEGWFE